MKLLRRLLGAWRVERRVPIDMDARFGPALSLGELRVALGRGAGDPVVRAVAQLMMMQRAKCLDAAQAWAFKGEADRAVAELGAVQALHDVLHEVILGAEGRALSDEVALWFATPEERERMGEK